MTFFAEASSVLFNTPIEQETWTFLENLLITIMPIDQNYK